jgi:hypothetical protein
MLPIEPEKYAIKLKIKIAWVIKRMLSNPS